MEEMNQSNIRNEIIAQCEAFNAYSSSISFEGMLVLELLRFRQSELSVTDIHAACAELEKISEEDFTKLLEGLVKEKTIVESDNEKYRFLQYPQVPFIEEIKKKNFYEPLFARKDMNVDNWLKEQNTFFKRVVERRREKMAPDNLIKEEVKEESENSDLVKVKTNQNLYFDFDAPTRLVESTIYLNRQTGKNQLELCIRNVSKNKIKAITADITALNEKMRDVASVKDVEITKLNASPKSLFGSGKYVELDTDKANDVRVTITKVTFKDEEPWIKPDNATEIFVLTPVEKRDNEIVLGAIKENLNIIPTYEYAEKSDYWMCSCGAPNKTDVKECILCGALKENFEKLPDKDYLKEIVEEYKFKEIVSRAKENSRYSKKAQKAAALKIESLNIEAEEERQKAILEHNEEIYNSNSNIDSVNTVEACEKAIEALDEIRDFKDTKKVIANFKNKIKELNDAAAKAEKLRQEAKARKRKRAKIITVIVIIVVIILAALALLWKYVLNPQLKYDDAISLRASGKFDEAITAFKEMGDYKDSKHQVDATIFEKGLSYFEDEDYSAAIEIFNSIPDFEGSGKKVLEANYLIATKAKDSEDYEEAVTLFEKISDYSDSKEQINYCKYQLAEGIVAEKKYKEAAEAFSAISDYSDSKERYTECMYHYALTFKNSKEQVEILKELPKEYKDVEDRINKYSKLEASAKKWQGTWKGYIQTKSNLEWKKATLKIETSVDDYILYYTVRLNDEKEYKNRLNEKISFGGYSAELTQDNKKVHIFKGDELSPTNEGWLSK